MTPARHRGAPYGAALALLAAITVATATWAGLGPLAVATRSARAAEPITTTAPQLASLVGSPLLGSDGRYTILFMGSDKRCRSIHSPLGAERCSSLAPTVAAASVEGSPASALYPYIWSSIADAKLSAPRNAAGSERTDVMTLLTVNPATGEAAALSIPRDLENFPLKPSLASGFCAPRSSRFAAKVNALYVYAQLCMKATPKLSAWDRSILAAERVRENLAYAFNIEIDDWVLATFGAADILGATLDTLAPGPTLVHLDDQSRFASCRTNRLRTGKAMSYEDANIASNARYGDLLFLRPGSVDRFGRRSGWYHANCREPGTTATVRTTSPQFIADSCSLTTASSNSCIFDVPSNLWVSFARARKYDGDTNRIRRAQRILSAITLRVIDAGGEIASALAGLAAMRWYSWAHRSASGVIQRWNAGPALVRGSIAPDDVATIFDIVATARRQLAAGPDSPEGWRSMLLLGQRVTLSDGSRCTVGGSSLFGATHYSSRLACTRAWVATSFGAVSP